MNEDTSTTTVAEHDFPIHWDDPDDAKRCWLFASRNFPNQVTPLEFDAARTMLDGMHRGRGRSAPAGLDYRMFNTFVYITMPAMAQPSPAESESLRSAFLGLDEQWRNEFLPEIDGILRELGATDPAEMSTAELATHVTTAARYLRRLFELHFRILAPAREAMNLFVATYRELLGGSELDAHVLLGGLPTKTMRCGQWFWRLSRVAAATPAVREVLAAEPSSTAVAALSEVDGAGEFLTELAEFLDEHGHRSEGTSIGYPSWREDPTPVIGTIKNYLAQPETADPELAVQRSAHAREQATADARERLAGYPRPVVDEFERLLTAARTGSVLSEENTHYINFGGVQALRRVLLAAGQRLAERAVIPTRDDVFLLTFAELRENLTSGSEADMGSVIEPRRAELRRWSGVTPPRFVGDTSGPSTDSSGGAGADRHVVVGAAGAAGTVRGVARLVTSLAESERLQPGEVLLTEMTQPSWTPLFTVAAAVVAATGGVLNHAAIAAREYGIPAVVGADGATTAIRDGEPVEVDGTAGVVRRLAAS